MLTSLTSDPPPPQLSFELDQVSLQSSSDLDLGCLYKSGTTEHRTQASVTQARVISCPLPAAHKLAELPQGKGELLPLI